MSAVVAPYNGVWVQYETVAGLPTSSSKLCPLSCQRSLSQSDAQTSHLSSAVVTITCTRASHHLLRLR